MYTSLARWEWRTFHTTFGGAESRIRAYPAKAASGRDVYIVANRTEASTRIRDLQIEIEELQETNREALERWRPVVREPFPITAAAVKAAFHWWALPAPLLRRTVYSVDEFVEEIVSPEPSLHRVHVRSQQHTFAIDECVVDITELTYNGLPLRTIGVQMFEPARVIETVRRLGLDRYENVNFVKSLRRFLTTDPVPARLPSGS